MHETFAEWAEYLTATGASPATVRTRTRALGALLRHAGRAHPDELTRQDVIRFLARDRAQWTKVTYWRSINAFDRWHTEFRGAPLDLVKGVPQPRQPDPVARPVDDFTIHQLLKARLPLRTRAYVLLALYEALRVHEIAKIRGEDLDLAANWLLVAGKGGMTAHLPLHPAIAELSEWMPEFGWWFPSRTDPRKHVTAGAVSQTITGALRSVGSTATAHQLRDTSATRFQRQYGDIRMTQTMMRHKSLLSTMKYTAVSDERMQTAVKSIDWAA